MKYFSLIIVLFCLAHQQAAVAAPAAPIPVQASQPDGTTFTVFARGDEHTNWTETADGYSVIRQGDTWFYAESDASGQLRASNNPVGSLTAVEKRALPQRLAPTRQGEVGELRTLRKIDRGLQPSVDGLDQPQAITHTQYVLTILVNYSNISFSYSDASFQSLMYGANNSVRHFYLENSYNGFAIEPAAESHGTANDGIVHVTRPVNHPNQGGNGNVSRAEARAIVQLTNSYVNYASFDANGDGVASADELSIVIIAAGYETSYGGTGVALTPNVWGHQSFFSSLSLDAVSLSPYTMFGERHGTASGTHQVTIGIMCHELGHLMLGLPDLYDIDGSSFGIGDWGLMGGGSWNRVGTFSGDSPSHLSAWSKVVTNFTLAQDIDTNQNGISIAQAETSEVARRIWIDKYKHKEYFLVENRQRAGYDAGLSSAGLLIWHVDDFKESNADESHKWVDLEEADGLAQLDAGTNDGNAGDPFPGSANKVIFDNSSNPNSRDHAGSDTGIGVSSISASGPGMTADFTISPAVVGDNVRYDENLTYDALGFNSTTAWAGMQVLNDTDEEYFDGVDVYVNDSNRATIDVYYYSSIAGGTPSGLIHSQTGFAASPGWNRLLLSSPQSFPAGAERGIVIRYVNDSYRYPITFDSKGPGSGRSYYDNNGVGAFTAFCPSFCGDPNLVVLLGSANVAPMFTPASAIARQQGSPAGAAVLVGEASDAETSPGALTVTQIAGGTATGITVSNLGNTDGDITAALAASCTATSGTLRFQVSDGNLSDTGDLQVNVTANSQPTLSYAGKVVNFSESGTHAALTGPSDNGSVNSVSVQGSGTYAGPVSVNSAGLVSFEDAQPVGSHSITIRAADNCGSIRDASFQLEVDAVLPGAPQMGLATAGDAEATISFTPPAFDGGAFIDSYTVVSNPGNLMGIGQTSPITVTGLSNGQLYTFAVTATNSSGTGPASAASNAVTPVAAQSIDFANPGDQDFGTGPGLTATATSNLPVTFSSNSNEVCTVTPEGTLSFVTTGNCAIAADQAGDAAHLPAPTIIQSFTVNAVVPGAPHIGEATAADEEASVSFLPPDFEGGAPVTSYTVTSNPGNIEATGGASPIAVTGLTNGQAYTFTVTATNPAGTGPASEPSNEVTPQAEVAEEIFKDGYE